MNKQIGPLEVVCDAPPYNIVRACRLIGLLRPEDVRWRRMSSFAKNGEGHGPHAGFFWKLVWATGGMKNEACSCGERLPLMEKYVFTLLHHGDVYYFLGQCPQCKTVYWEED